MNFVLHLAQTAPEEGLPDRICRGVGEVVRMPGNLI